MKKIMLITSLLITFIITPTLYGKPPVTKNQPAKPVQQPLVIMPVAPMNNDLLSTLLENAKLLVNQISANDQSDEAKTARKKALVEIANAEKKLLANAKNALIKEIYTEIQAQTDIIIRESKAFFAHRMPLKKYNPKKATTALVELATEIENAAQSSSEQFATETGQALQRAIIEAQRITTKAKRIINKTSLQVTSGKITPVQAAKIVGEQNNIIANAQRALALVQEQAQKDVAQNDMQAGYLSQLVSGIYNVGTSALAPFKAGYGYTQEEKDVARAIIAALENQLKKANSQADIQELNNEIYNQQLITGDAMSFNRKLFWGAVGVAGTLGAAYLAQQQLGSQTLNEEQPNKLEEANLSTVNEEQLNNLMDQQRNLEWNNITTEASSAPLLPSSPAITNTDTSDKQQPDTMEQPTNLKLRDDETFAQQLVPHPWESDNTNTTEKNNQQKMENTQAVELPTETDSSNKQQPDTTEQPTNIAASNVATDTNPEPSPSPNSDLPSTENNQQEMEKTQGPEQSEYEDDSHPWSSKIGPSDDSIPTDNDDDNITPSDNTTPAGGVFRNLTKEEMALLSPAEREYREELERQVAREKTSIFDPNYPKLIQPEIQALKDIVNSAKQTTAEKMRYLQQEVRKASSKLTELATELVNADSEERRAILTREKDNAQELLNTANSYIWDLHNIANEASTRVMDSKAPLG